MEFQSPFSQILFRKSDPNVISRLSPSGCYMACIGTNGDLQLVDLQSGHVLGFLCLKSQQHITGFKWVTDQFIILTSDSGEVLKANLIYDKYPHDKLATLSTIIPAGNKAVLAMCYHRVQAFLAVAFPAKIELWQWEKSAVPPHWALFDTIKCKTNGFQWNITDIMFIQQDRGTCLLIVRDTGFVIWKKHQEGLGFYRGENDEPLSYFAESPNCSLLAASCADLSISIWPLTSRGPDMAERETFNVPTGREWAGHTLPIAFSSNSGLILAADPVGTVYVFSLQGDPQYTF
ncbi:hypothetical protein FRC12_001489 [Ceratobasidium sp. 428]|nr:hypothetical protein FRC12_001489 [Ceratobasidium sp. 428]